MGLQPFACWDCEFESRRGHGGQTVVSVVWCSVEISATGRSLVQSSPTEKDASKCDLETSKMWRPRPTRAVKQWKKKLILEFHRKLITAEGSKNVTFLFVFFFGRDSPQWVRASSFTRFLNHTHRRTTLGRTPLDE